MNDWSLKRLAWAYGCAKKGSDEEMRLERALRRRLDIEALHRHREECGACLCPCCARVGQCGGRPAS